MKLNHTFTVPAPVEQAWAALLDVEQVATCMPGAALDSYDGETFAGTVRVKIGAISLTYAGQGTFVERDDTDRRVVMRAAGKERRGGGNASALVTCRLSPQDGGTLATVETDLTITGKPAQFGRGAIEDIGGKIVDQFARNLAAQLTLRSAAAPADAVAEQSASVPAPAPAAVPRADAIDLLALAGPVVVKKATVGALGVIAVAMAVVLVRRCRG